MSASLRLSSSAGFSSILNQEFTHKVRSDACPVGLDQRRLNSRAYNFMFSAFMERRSSLTHVYSPLPTPRLLLLLQTGLASFIKNSREYFLFYPPSFSSSPSQIDLFPGVDTCGRGCVTLHPDLKHGSGILGRVGQRSLQGRSFPLGVLCVVCVHPAEKCASLVSLP